MLNDGSHTQTNWATNGVSTPDITIVHNSRLGSAEWCTVEDLGSDHLPILTVLGCGVATRFTPVGPKLRWNWKAAD